ncbi:MAG TPA: Holliday junction branch migration protein RuvA [Candidatus Saccharimonadales bacterium]|nr:Holliday junction branch migration protein RuvA [Candidatus Saccharimonadales bacterium]
MIAHLSGQLVEKMPASLIVDVGGIGYEVLVAQTDFASSLVGQPIKVFIYDYLRETAHELFGFSELGAKHLFEQLISVSGVGPKMALAVLGLGDVADIRSAIAASNSAFIQQASGVGKRLAERIVVDLKDKVGVAGVSFASAMPKGDDALDALLALGYSMQQAGEVLRSIDTSLETQARIKQALQALGNSA